MATHAVVRILPPLLLAVSGALALADGLKQPQERVIFGFGDEQDSWLSVNDGVMGGLSQGEARRTEADTLVFAGTLSLENNGGFSSVRSRPGTLDLGRFEGLALRLKGDGRRYYLNLHTEARVTPASWRADITTTGGWQDLRVPFGDFRWTVFGRRVPASPLDPAEVLSLGVTIADKKEGPFRLEIDHVAAYGPRDPLPTIAEIIGRSEDLSVFASAVEAAGLNPALRGAGPFTVFAPSDAALESLPEESLDALSDLGRRPEALQMVLRHVAYGSLLLRERRATRLDAGLAVISAEGAIRAGGAEIIRADLVASNGVVHVIDQPMPPDPARPGTAESGREAVRSAIRTGVPLFNAGNPHACAAVYEAVLAAVLADEKVPIGPKVREEGLAVLRNVSARGDPDEAAWALRGMLDAVLEDLAKQG